MNKSPAAKRTSTKVGITQEVIASIAAIAASEVEGFERLAGGLAAIFGGGTAQKGQGVETRIERNSLRISMKVIVKYGYPIHEVAREIQRRVKQEVEAMTGLRVRGVDVYVQDLQLPGNKVRGGASPGRTRKSEEFSI